MTKQITVLDEAREFVADGMTGHSIVKQLVDEIETLRRHLTTICGTKNHLDICDRMMGDSHACTCGTRAAARYLAGLSNERAELADLHADAPLGLPDEPTPP